MKSSDMQFIVGQITALGDNLARRLDGIDRRFDRLETRLDTLIDALAGHAADPNAHGRGDS